MMMKDDLSARNDWKIRTVVETFPGTDGLVRNVKIRMGNRRLDKYRKPISDASVLTCPIQKLVLLAEA